MRSAHDEVRAAEIRSVHCPIADGWRKVCAACGQSWPCTDYSWAVPQPPGPRTWQDLLRMVALIVVLMIAVPAATAWLLPAWAWAGALAAMPIVVFGALVVASRRRP